MIVGEQEAGHATKVKKQIDNIIDNVNTSTFDLAELLHEVKKQGYYDQWGHESFGDYAKSLDLKVSKSYYLVRIVDTMEIVGLKREEYEPVGIAKLRLIAKLKPEGEFKGKPMSEVIRELTLKAKELEPEEVKEAVNILNGLTGDDSIVWLNLAVKKSVRDAVIRPAIEVAKKNIGSVGKDEEGDAKDASDGAALEVICADFMSDPANNYDTDELNKE
jgi:hypothetical protein